VINIGAKVLCGQISAAAIEVCTFNGFNGVGVAAECMVSAQSGLPWKVRLVVKGEGGGERGNPNDHNLAPIRDP
jgi:hypothetical protein